MNHLLPSRSERPPRAIRVAVDLSHLRPGGENGGVKPFLFETLLWLGRQQRTPLQFFYLTCASTHAEISAQIARVQDEVICVRADDGPLPDGDEQVPRERLFLPPPLDLLLQLDAQVLYCPFGPVEFATPGICTVSTVVDVLHRDFPWSLAPHHNAERERMFLEVVAVADRLQCISNHVVSRMQQHYQVPPERMFTGYIAIHQRFAAWTPDAGVPPANEAAEKTPAGPFFFYPANAWKHKNHEALLLAYGIYHAHALAAGRVPWPLLLTGHEEKRWWEMRDLAATLGLLQDGAIQFRGYVPASEFGSLWNAAGALVFPSLHEGFGIPLLEAMEHDVPVLCSRDGSLPEIGADACLFVDARLPEALAEGMTRLATDPLLRRQLAAAGRRRLADFSLDRESGYLLDAIVELSRTKPPYRPFTRGIFPDGWTERLALLALPAGPTDESVLGRLTLLFHSLPVPRRLRLRLGESVALGSFTIPANQADYEISVDFRAGGETLRMEILDAANLDPDDARLHGVHLLTANLRLANGEKYSLFSAR